MDLHPIAKTLSNKNEKRKRANRNKFSRLISLMNSFAALAHGRHICLLEFAIVLKLKNSKKYSSREMQRLHMNPP